MGATRGEGKTKKNGGEMLLFFFLFFIFWSAETLSLKFHYFSFIFNDPRAKFEAFKTIKQPLHVFESKNRGVLGSNSLFGVDRFWSVFNELLICRTASQ